MATGRPIATSGRPNRAHRSHRKAWRGPQQMQERPTRYPAVAGRPDKAHHNHRKAWWAFYRLQWAFPCWAPSGLPEATGDVICAPRAWRHRPMPGTHKVGQGMAPMSPSQVHFQDQVQGERDHLRRETAKKQTMSKRRVQDPTLPCIPCCEWIQEDLYLKGWVLPPTPLPHMAPTVAWKVCSEAKDPFQFSLADAKMQVLESPYAVFSLGWSTFKAKAHEHLPERI